MHKRDIGLFAGLILILYIYPLIGIRLLNPILTILGIAAGIVILSAAAGIFSENKIKYAYPAASGVLFVPTVWLYYNSSALVYAAVCAVISTAGLLLGIFAKQLLCNG